MKIPRSTYAALYGPTTGDRVRLGDTALWIEVEREDLARLIQEPQRSQIVARLKTLGYTYVTLNLEGFRSGSLNDVLPEEQRVTLRSGHKEET